jgi:hypothetical protein
VTAAAAATCRERCGLQLPPLCAAMTPPPHAGPHDTAADVTGLQILKERRRQSARLLGSAAGARLLRVNGLGAMAPVHRMCLAEHLAPVGRVTSCDDALMDRKRGDASMLKTYAGHVQLPDPHLQCMVSHALAEADPSAAGLAMPATSHADLAARSVQLLDRAELSAVHLQACCVSSLMYHIAILSFQLLCITAWSSANSQLPGLQAGCC